nr:hypothetical protein [Tanacetum cinerariifolium]
QLADVGDRNPQRIVLQQAARDVAGVRVYEHAHRDRNRHQPQRRSTLVPAIRAVADVAVPAR